jgi:hypothetical protein
MPVMAHLSGWQMMSARNMWMNVGDTTVMIFHTPAVTNKASYSVDPVDDIQVFSYEIE